MNYKIAVPLFAAVLTVFLGVAADGQTATLRNNEIAAPDGRIRGKLVGHTIEFLGVPYAQAPIGDFRWSPPRPVQHWSEVWESSGNNAQVFEGESIFAELDDLKSPDFGVLSSESLRFRICETGSS